MTWREHKPEPGDALKDFPGMIRSQKTAFDVIMRRFFYWSDSVQSAGMPRGGTSDNTGVARAFYGLASQVSGGHWGGLMVTSDTSRLFNLSVSGGAVLLGGQRSIVHDSIQSAQITTGQRYLVQSAATPASGGLAQGQYVQNFPSVFAAVPRILIMPVVTSAVAIYTASVSTATTGGFSYAVDWCGSGADPSSFTMMWRASAASALW